MFIDSIKEILMNEIIWLFVVALVIIACLAVIFVLKNKFEKSSLEKIDNFKNESQELLFTKNEIVENYKIAETTIAEQILIINDLQNQIKYISEKTSTPLATPVDKQSTSILVVDDSMVVRNKMKKLLETAEYEVVTANDGLDALDKLAIKKFSLIITDLEMPNLNGFGLIIKLNENPSTKEIPIMAITGHEEVEIKIDKCENLYSISKKPWLDSEILKKVAILSSVKK